MAVLTTLANLKTHLGITDTAEDVRLTQWLDAVDQAVLSSLRRGPFVSTSHTEYHSGTDRHLLPLKYRPLTAVAGVWVDSAGFGGHGQDAFPDSSEWVIGREWFPMDLEETESNGSLLAAIHGFWPCGQKNIKVVYTAGYTTVPADLELAVHELVTAVRMGAEKGGIIGEETIGRYSYKLINGQAGTGDALVTARSILAKYREVHL